jgi:hypothetical protein
MASRDMPALVAGIHALAAPNMEKDVDGRDKPGHDGLSSCLQLDGRAFYIWRAETGPL